MPKEMYYYCPGVTAETWTLSMTGLAVYNNHDLPFTKARKVTYYHQYCDLTLYLLLLFTDRFIRNLILIIVLPLTLAALFIVVVCVKFRPTFKSISEQNEVSKHSIPTVTI